MGIGLSLLTRLSKASHRFAVLRKIPGTKVPSPKMGPKIEDPQLFDVNVMPRILAIGDIHFRAKEVREGDAYIEAVVSVSTEARPHLIVLLGDILDTHELVRIGPFLQASKLIERLRAIAPVYVLMGNHDLRSGAMYLSDEHAFRPFKEWKEVTIVDTPIEVECDGRRIGMVPYVPPGRFVEALSTLGETWKEADVILAHQEFEGADLGGILSEAGDPWSTDLPAVVSGHIHTEQRLDSGVIYVGSSRQTSFGDEDIKGIGLLTWEPELRVSILELPLRGKKTLRLPVEDMVPEVFDRKVTDELRSRFNLRLIVFGTEEKLMAFKKTPFFKRVRTLDPLHLTIVLSPASLSLEPIEVEPTPTRTYTDVLRQLIGEASPQVQELARTLELVT